MEFRTVQQPLHMEGSISHTTPVMLLGSCFSDNIGSRMRNALFNVMANPFGTLYNPASILAVIQRIISCEPLIEQDLISHGRMYHSFLCHSSLSSVHKDKMLAHINGKMMEAHDFLKSASWLILTLGTAWVYRLRDTGCVVSNCHKLPTDTFLRTRLSCSETQETLMDIARTLHGFNTSLRIMVTVSPIRHLADGAHGNQISKATLLLATQQLTESYTANGGITYFPAYEIMMDDLRDYRFYAPDMCHPSETAVDYIYRCFSDSFFSPGTLQLAAQCEKYTRRLRHRPLTDDTESHLAFTEATDNIRQRLITTYPYLEQAITNIQLFNQ